MNNNEILSIIAFLGDKEKALNEKIKEPLKIVKK